MSHKDEVYFLLLAQLYLICNGYSGTQVSVGNSAEAAAAKVAAKVSDGGMGKRSLLFAVLRKVALEIPALVVLNALFPLYGLAYAQLCAEVVLAVAAVGMLRRIFRDAERAAGLR